MALRRTASLPCPKVGRQISAIKARTQTINQLKAVLVAADPVVREALSGLSNTMLIRRCAQLEASAPHDVTNAAVYTLRLLRDACSS